jgi:hypothetical protein
VASIVAALEARNPLAQPTQHLDQVDGTWELLYTTISITVRAAHLARRRCCGARLWCARCEVGALRRPASGVDVLHRGPTQCRCPPARALLLWRD